MICKKYMAAVASNTVEGVQTIFVPKTPAQPLSHVLQPQQGDFAQAVTSVIHPS